MPTSLLLRIVATGSFKSLAHIEHMSKRTISFRSGRQFLFRLFVIAVFVAALRARAADDPLDVDFKTAISRGDLDYTYPATRSEEGMPVGNGRMGSLVWTTPSALKFQINRCDVFGEDASTVSFPQQDSDYASGCGYVDINVVSAGPTSSPRPNFNQHLSLYDGIMTAKGAGLTARVLAWNAHDVMAIEIDDQRKHPEPINIDLRMLRYDLQYFNSMNWQLTSNHAVIYKTANHYATSQLHIRDGAILLTQRFAENKFFDSSAIAISVVGRESRQRLPERIHRASFRSLRAAASSPSSFPAPRRSTAIRTSAIWRSRN